MNEELTSLIEDAAKLLGLKPGIYTHDRGLLVARNGNAKDGFWFNPCDPERGDLMKVAKAAGLVVNHGQGEVRWQGEGMYGRETFMLNSAQSLALAILRAASAVLHSRGGV